MNGVFRVAQVNARHSKAVWASLGQAALEEHLDVVLIQEPPPQSVMENNLWPGFRIAVATPSPAHSVIMFRSTLGCSSCNFLGPWVCGVQMPFRGSSLVLISAYIRHTSGEGVSQLSNAIAKASEMSPFVLWEWTLMGTHRCGARRGPNWIR